VKTVTLPASAAKFVAAGGRDIESKEPLAAGEHAQLVDSNGEELGLAVADPDNGKLRMFASPADGFAKIDAALLGWRVERALAWRRQLGIVGEESAYHLIHGAGDGLPGLTCDVLGRVAVVYAYGPGLVALAKPLAEACVGFGKLDGAVIKLRGKGEHADVEVIGKVEDRAVVTEHGVPFEVHPKGSLNTGLFTDMREHRRGLARFAAGKRVLNLFSYTGALSVACARAGAASVVSVDTSEGVAAWARGNFARSGLTGDAWRFETGDAVRFLARAARDREQYDLVIIDPPTFSTARGQPWTIERDYLALIAQAAAVCTGTLWLASNSHELASLAKLVKVGAVVEQGGLPPEYPTLAAQPRDRYLQICVVRIS
jgi:23S rRNA (cytosine1962-C5)-methyltransferase